MKLEKDNRQNFVASMVNLLPYNGQIDPYQYQSVSIYLSIYLSI